MKKKRGPVVVDGEELGACPGCGFTPIRASWMARHDCGWKVCRVCREQTQDCCKRSGAK